RDADDDDVAPLEDREVRGRLVAAVADQRDQIAVGQIRGAGPPVVEGGDFVEVRVDAGDRESDAGELDGQGQADIALADDPDAARVRADPLNERSLGHFVSSVANALRAFASSWGSRYVAHRPLMPIAASAR